MIIIKIDGEIKGKGRPKFARRENFVSTYTPKETTNYENLVKLMYLEQNRDNVSQIKYFNNEPLKLEITAVFEIPKSFSKKKTAMALNKLLYPTKKPDYDNIEKIVTDALNKVAYQDDSQIVSNTTNKIYGETPYVEIKIQAINEDIIYPSEFDIKVD